MREPRETLNGIMFMTSINNDWGLQFVKNAQKIFNMVPQKNLNKLSRDLIERNGLNFQISICMEEITELATELMLDKSFEDTAAEIADVFITLNHVTVGYNIRRTVNASRMQKIKNPQFMAGNNERMLALFDLQKELIKHTNRKKDNMRQIIERTADAYVVLARLIMNFNNFSLVRQITHEKMHRTRMRNK